VIKLFEHLNILYVEDSENDTILMNYQLKDICQNINFERVETKDELKSKIKTKKWHVAIIDNTLPQLTAMDAIEIIKKQNADLPMICVSGSEMFDIKDKCLDAGAKAFILKSETKELVKAVEDILQECFG
jgi:CheY-like chemotaxis protein